MMIAKLTGTIDHIEVGALIIDVNGVGYYVQASQRTLARLGDVGAPCSVLIETQIREDAFNLFGFCDASEREWFRLLTSVQGVGAKAAMAILGVTPPEKLGFAIAAGDSVPLRQADGVGPKLATRIVTELKDKAAKMDLAALSKQAVNDKIDAKANKMPSVPQASQTDSTAAENGQIDHDVVSALVNLGYGRSDAYAAVATVRSKGNDNNDLNDILKASLKELSS